MSSVVIVKWIKDVWPQWEGSIKTDGLKGESGILLVQRSYKTYIKQKIIYFIVFLSVKVGEWVHVMDARLPRYLLFFL